MPTRGVSKQAGKAFLVSFLPKKLNPQERHWPGRHAALRKVHGDDVIGTPTTMSMHGDDAVGTPYYNEGLT